MPKGLFDKCVGIVFVNTVKVGLIFSGTVGSGIALRKTENGWSPPCAVGLSNLGFGILAGVSVSDLIIFVFDEESMKALVANKGMTLGTNIELTVGLGREANLTDTFAGKDKIGATFAIAYSKGAFGGIAAQGGVLTTRDSCNNKFYSAVSSGEDILFKPESVRVPEHKQTMLNEVYDKLNKAAAGSTAEPDAAEEAKKQTTKEAADKEEEVVKSDPTAGIVAVDSSAS